MAFRDDREALLGRVAALESELGREREGSAARRELAGELDILAAQVRAATGELDQDRAALGEVSAALERLRGRVSPAPPPVAVAPAAAAPASSLSHEPGWGAKHVLLGLSVIVLVVTLIVVLARAGGEELPAARPNQTAEEHRAAITRAAEQAMNSTALVPFSCDITSQPSGAEVMRKDVVLGKTPLRMQFGNGDSLHNYRVQLAGHDHGWLDIPNQPVGCKVHVELRARP